jgi:hypothetical protein
VIQAVMPSNTSVLNKICTFVACISNKYKIVDL